MTGDNDPHLKETAKRCFVGSTSLLCVTMARAGVIELDAGVGNLISYTGLCGPNAAIWLQGQEAVD